MTKPLDFRDRPPELVAPFGPYRGIVSRILDGDTLTVWLDLGLSCYTREAIRLADVDCPELWQPGGPEAARFVAETSPPGTPCMVATRKTPRSRREAMSFTRYIGDIRLSGGRDLGEIIIANGHGSWA